MSGLNSSKIPIAVHARSSPSSEARGGGAQRALLNFPGHRLFVHPPGRGNWGERLPWYNRARLLVEFPCHKRKAGMTHALITGGAGFIGSHLAEYCWRAASR